MFSLIRKLKILLLLVFSLAYSQVATNTNTGIGYTNIQSAVTAANPGETIAVNAGYWNELISFTSKSDITLTSYPYLDSGNSAGTVISNGGIRVIDINNSANITIIGISTLYGNNAIEFRGTSPGGRVIQSRISDATTSGVRVASEASDSVLIESNTIVGNGAYGVQVVNGADNISISHNIISNHTQNSVYFNSTSTTDCEVISNELTHAGSAGIRINTGTGTKVYRNLIASNNNYGIQIQNSSSVEIVNNVIVFNLLDDGIRFINGSTGVVYNNIISDNGSGGTDDFGLDNDSTNTVTADYNLFYNNFSGEGNFTPNANNIIGQDPQFTNYFEIPFGSPGYDNGLNPAGSYNFIFEGNGVERGWKEFILPCSGAPSTAVITDVTPVSSSELSVTWTDSSDEYFYNIYWNIFNSKPTSPGALATSNTTNYLISGLSPATPVYVWVEASNYCGRSPDGTASGTTLPSSGPPQAPSLLTTGILSSSSVELNWQDNSGDETGFNIYWNTVNVKPSTPNASTELDVTTYSPAGLNSSQTYYFWVEATNTFGASGDTTTSANTTGAIFVALNTNTGIYYTTITNAIAEVNAGEVIVVFAGTYTGDINISKDNYKLISLPWLQSGDRDAVRITGGGNGFNFQSHNYVTVQGFSVYNVAVSMANMTSSEYCEILNNRMYSNTDITITAWGGTGFKNNKIISNEAFGPSQNNLIWLQSGDVSNLIAYNYLHHLEFEGIGFAPLEYPSFNQFIGNVIVDVVVGFAIHSGNSNIFTGNIVTRNNNGIVHSDGSGNVFTYNNITNNAGIGVNLSNTASGNTIQYNNICNNGINIISNNSTHLISDNSCAVVEITPVVSVTNTLVGSAIAGIHYFAGSATNTAPNFGYPAVFYRVDNGPYIPTGSGPSWSRYLSTYNLTNGPHVFSFRAINTFSFTNEWVQTNYVSNAQSSISISNATANEADGLLTFTIYLDISSIQRASVDYTIQNGSASNNLDFSNIAGTVYFAPGTTSNIISVPLINDSANELTEMFTVQLSGESNCILIGPNATGTIIDDDFVSISINNATSNENDSNISFYVYLDRVSVLPVAVAYTTVNGSATHNSDYLSNGGLIAFLPGELTNIINIPLIDDFYDEATETFSLKLYSLSNSAFLLSNATGTILDDDPVYFPLISETNQAGLPTYLTGTVLFAGYASNVLPITNQPAVSLMIGNGSTNFIYFGTAWLTNLDTTSLPDGPLDFHFIASDYTNRATTNSFSYIVDNSPPEISLVSDISNNSLFDTAILQFLISEPHSGITSAYMVISGSGVLITNNLQLLTGTQIFQFDTTPFNNGTYSLTLYAWNGVGMSNVIINNYTFTINNLNFKPIVGPNPLIASKHPAVVINGLDWNSTIHIYTIAGNLVRTYDQWEIADEFSVHGLGNIEWDLKNSTGSDVGSGVYIFEISGSVEAALMKVSILRD